MMARLMKSRFFGANRRPLFGPGLVLLLALLWCGLAVAAVTARLDAEQVYEGGTLTLTIELAGDASARGSGLDLTPLSADFDVVGTSQSNEFSIINGRASVSRQWRITLAPKRTGELHIPPLTVGSDSTGPLRVQVNEVPAGALGGPGDDVFIEMELERPAGLGPDDPVMVQQHLPLVVRLHSALPLRGGTLSDPRAEGAVLERLGADQRYNVNRNGRDYQVIERRYSLSPERSGELRIPPVVFEGELVPGVDPRSGAGRAPPPAAGRSRMDRMFEDFPFAADAFTAPLSLFEPGRAVRAQSGALRLQVAAQPDAFGADHWLPAEGLSVTDSWAESPPQLRVGEPATRTLTLTARGLAGSQIPDVEMRLPDEVRAYREPSANETRTDGRAVFAVSRQAMTLIPTQPGTLRLPELRIRWWDTQAQRERETLVPALNLSVGGTLGTAAPALPVDTETTSPGQGRAAAPETTTGAANARLSLGQLLVALLALLGLAAAAVAVMMVVARQRALTEARPLTERDPGLGALRDALRQAAEKDLAQPAAEALLELARTLWSDQAPLNLGSLARRLQQLTGAQGSAAAEAIAELERALYAPAGEHWFGQGFAEQVLPALESLREDTGARGQDDGSELPPLYPDRHPDRHLHRHTGSV